MSVAKGKFFLSKEQLEKIMMLPDGVEIMGVKELEFQEGFEFTLVSAEETKVTRKGIPVSQMRRSVLRVEEVPNLPFDLPSQHSTKVTSNQIEISVDVNGNVKLGDSVRPVLNQNEKDVKSIFENIVNDVRKKGLK